jgi:hypothetical protein
VLLFDLLGSAAFPQSGFKLMQGPDKLAHMGKARLFVCGIRNLVRHPRFSVAVWIAVRAEALKPLPTEKPGLPQLKTTRHIDRKVFPLLSGLFDLINSGAKKPKIYLLNPASGSFPMVVLRARPDVTGRSRRMSREPM